MFYFQDGHQPDRPSSRETTTQHRIRRRQIDFVKLLNDEEDDDEGARVQCPKCKKYSSRNDSKNNIVWYGCDNCPKWWHRECLSAEEKAKADLSCMLATVEFHCQYCVELEFEQERICGVCLQQDDQDFKFWVQCSKCDGYFHVFCFNDSISQDIQVRKMNNSPWSCLQCNYED